MGSVLVASLGKSPGVITALVDALREKGKKIEKVIPIYIKDAANSTGEPIEITELEREFKNYSGYKNIEFNHDDSWIAGRDIGSKEEKEKLYYATSGEFCKKAIEIISKIKQNNQDVIVGIGGGRKTMSAIMTYSALIKGVDEIYQIMVSNDIENIGNPKDYLRFGKREQALHPEQNQRWLVKLPNRDRIDEIRDEINNKGIEGISDIIEEKETF